MYNNAIEDDIGAFYGRVVHNICHDDLNLGDCIRKYISAPIYKILLGDNTSDIYLVKDDKNEKQIYLASKFLPNFKTAADEEDNKKLQATQGFENTSCANITGRRRYTSKR